MCDSGGWGEITSPYRFIDLLILFGYCVLGGSILAPWQAWPGSTQAESGTQTLLASIMTMTLASGPGI